MKTFCDLYSITENKEAVSSRFEENKWCSMEYTTKLGKGQLLVTASGCKSEPIVLNPNLNGWQKIYIGFFHMCTPNYSFIKLTDDEEYTPIEYMTNGSPHNWINSEYMQEIYWKCADLTNQRIILENPEYIFPTVSGIAWIRCEAMTDEEIIRYKNSLNKEIKCVQMHFDIDGFYLDRSIDKKEHFANFSMLKNTNADFCTLEYSMLFEEHPHKDKYVPLVDREKCYTSGKYTYDEIFDKYLDLAKQYNIPLYAAERMSVASFHIPFTRPDLQSKFVLENDKFHCKNRDGSKVQVCSYAYVEVQDYVLKRMIKMVKKGFQGVSMIFHRGIHIGFEEPVINIFKEKYPEIDPHTLPVTDERLHSVWCEIMTGFMRKVRETLDDLSDEHININVITEYGLQSSKNFGLDVETWAKEGLIDCVSQGDMEIYEDLADCMSDENPDLIDLDKYKKRMEDYQVLKRNFATNVDKVCKHIPEYLRLEERYGVKVYHVLPWINSILPENYMKEVERMRQCGAKRFLAWNTNHMIRNRPEFLLVSSLGNDMGVDVPLRNFYRVLSLDSVDISQAVPNWRG